MRFLSRIKREVASAMVEKGVTERVRLAEVYEMKKSDLEKQHENVREAFKQKKAEVRKMRTLLKQGFLQECY